MSDDENKKKDASTEGLTAGFLEGLYGDPLRAETVRTGRHLIIASAVCTVVVVFNVRLQGTGLVPLDFGNRSDVLAMLLALAVFLLCISFVLRSWTDLLRERETAKLVTKYIEDARVEAARKSAQDAENSFLQDQQDDHEQYYRDDDPDPWWESYYKVSKAADEAVQRAEERLGMRQLPRQLRHVRTILETGVPIGFALIAIFLSRASSWAFFKAVFLGG